ncbi:MAG: hypothetical protein JNN28_06290 [Saprospiraceae bacterium]|nr:hypothetical protein [Saprospiraceae bacterium]
MSNLAKLQQRKAELAAKLELQRVEIKQTLLEVKTEVEPSNLLKKAVKGVFSKGGEKGGSVNSGTLAQGVSFLLDLLVRDPRLSVVLKLVTPMALKLLPLGAKQEENPEKVEKDLEKALKPNFYGKLRQGVSALRGKLKNKEEAPEPPLTNPDQ